MTNPTFKPSIEPASDNRSPLVRFRATLKEYAGVEKSNDRGSFMVVKFDFTDVVVIESTEPYPFPIAAIELGYNQRSGTTWDEFAKSAKRVLGVNDIDLLVGKTQEWYYGSCELRRPLRDEAGVETGKWGMVPAHSWQVVSVEGFGSSESNGTGSTLTEALVDLVTGKTDAEFYQALFTNTELKKMAGFNSAVEAASNRELLKGFETAGLIKQNSEGVWSKV